MLCHLHGSAETCGGEAGGAIHENQGRDTSLFAASTFRRPSVVTANTLLGGVLLSCRPVMSLRLSKWARRVRTSPGFMRQAAPIAAAVA